jgi:hypothetical protein
MTDRESPTPAANLHKLSGRRQVGIGRSEAKYKHFASSDERWITS